jgi:hypothetical protein
LLSQFPNEPYAQRECLHAISNAGNATVRHLLSNDRQLLDSWLDFQDIIVEEFSRDISNPISEAGPVDFRQAFVNINIRGLTDFFAHVVIHAWEHIADNHLGWMMHRSILHCAASKPTWCTAHQRTLRDSFEDAWVELLTSDEPIEDWDPFPEDSSSMIDDDVDDDEDNIPDGLSAVSFEPVGEDYNVHRFAARVHIEEEGLLCLICHFDLTNTADDGPPMKLNVCSHIYHFDCLSQHINGVESWSTTCPSCREKICEPRGKRPKIGEDVEMQGAGNQNTDEAEQ